MLSAVSKPKNSFIYLNLLKQFLPTPPLKHKCEHDVFSNEFPEHSTFYAIGQGNIYGVYKHLSALSERGLEASLDLAIHAGQDLIVKILSKEMKERQNNLKNDEKQKHQKRQVFRYFFLQNEYFYEINIEIFLDKNTIDFSIHFHTDNQFYYLQQHLSGLGGKNESGRILFSYNYKNLTENEISLKILDICLALNKLRQENFDKIFVGLNILFEKTKNTALIIEDSNVHQTYTFIEYWSTYFRQRSNYKKLRVLLRYNGNPDSNWGSLSHSAIIAYLKAFKAAGDQPDIFHTKIKKNFKKIRETLNVLIEYGAHPFHNSQYGNLLHAIVSQEKHSIDSWQKEFWRDTAWLLPASEESKTHMLIHQDLTQSIMTKTIFTVNQKMQDFISQKKYIAGLKIENDKEISISLKNGEELNIRTHKASELNDDEKNLLGQFFVAQEKVKVDDNKKFKYFIDQLKNNAGITYVDVIRSKNKSLVGVFVYEYIDDEKTFVYYMKLVTAKMSECPGLIQLLILLRGFCCTQPDYTSISFGEAASRHGFALANILIRCPTHIVTKINMQALFKIVYKGKNLEEIIVKRNGCYYLKDQMSVEQPSNKASTNNLVTLFSLSADTFDKLYKHPGLSLCVAYFNDKENLRLLREKIYPDISDEDFHKLFIFFAKSIQEFFLDSSGRKPTMTAKL